LPVFFRARRAPLPPHKASRSFAKPKAPSPRFVPSFLKPQIPKPRRRAAWTIHGASPPAPAATSARSVPRATSPSARRRLSRRTPSRMTSTRRRPRLIPSLMTRRRRRCGALRLLGRMTPTPTSYPAGRGPTSGCAWARRPRSIRTASRPHRPREGLLWRAIGCLA